ncbi:unnamed protein product [Paramecium sonneborni]|uniref:Uncharacterized protein n=1 Tax=Paramecium sonneborni TaxID=65129 RepID=A0A8S1RMP6_9CILI|nr:unnamed protein product [Paramecium sonneborni]
MLKLTEIMDQACNFCEFQYVHNLPNQDFAVIIKKALYEKYSSSQIIYIRIINDLIFARRSRNYKCIQRLSLLGLP